MGEYRRTFNKRHSLRRVKDKKRLMEMRAAGRYAHLLKSIIDAKQSVLDRNLLCETSTGAQFNRHSVT